MIWAKLCVDDDDHHDNNGSVHGDGVGVEFVPYFACQLWADLAQDQHRPLTLRTFQVAENETAPSGLFVCVSCWSAPFDLYDLERTGFVGEEIWGFLQ